MNAPLEYYDLSYIAYKRIKSMILENKLAPGEKIIQEKLAAELGVSRMPLHKAFQRLENEMLVEHVPRKGIFVRTINHQEIADAFECREVIECLAVRRAAVNLSEKDIQFLYKLFAPFAKNPEAADLMKYEEADFIFHNTILQKSGNKILLKMEMLSNVITRTYQTGLIRNPGETFIEHMAIIDALACKDVKKAESLLKEHFTRSRNRILDSIKAHDFNLVGVR